MSIFGSQFVLRLWVWARIASGCSTVNMVPGNTEVSSVANASPNLASMPSSKRSSTLEMAAFLASGFTPVKALRVINALAWP